MSKFTTKCNACHGTTSKQYARQNGGKCKPCVTGNPRQQSHPDRQARMIDSGYQAYAREEGYYDTPY